MSDFADIRFRDLEFFTRLAVSGSITQAARDVGVPKATASRWLTQLEERVGVALVKRTTRSVALTDAGAEFARRARELLAEGYAAQAAVRSDMPGGTLRVSVPVPMGRMLSGPVIARFKRRFPSVRLEIRLENRRVDLIEEGIDLAIRGGALDDSELLTRQLSSASMWLYASARLQGARLEEMTLIASPGDDVLLRRSSLDAKLEAGVVVDDRTAVADALVWGAGVGMLPSFLGEPRVADGSLWRAWDRPIAGLPIHAVYHKSHRDDARLLALIDELEGQLDALL